MDCFSNREQKILKIIGRKKLRLYEIAEELFKGEKKVPLDPTIVVANSVTRIIRKCEHFNVGWTLDKIRVHNKLYIKRMKR